MDFAVARENMVEGQIRPNKVTDERLIEAMRSLPRELFVPDPLKGIAYVDEDIDLGNGCFLIEPMILARLIQAAEIDPEDVVLDVGCGTGYSTAILGQLAATAVGIEQDKTIAEQADTLIHTLDITNAVIIEGDPAQGYPAQAPYNVILINGAVSKLPENIVSQLAPGGRLVTVISEKGRMGQATLTKNIQGVLSTQPLFDASTMTLPAFETEEGFTF